LDPPLNVFPPIELCQLAPVIRHFRADDGAGVASDTDAEVVWEPYAQFRTRRPLVEAVVDSQCLDAAEAP
jgi:hypothetical protein